jgi:hypothetical protein
MTAAVWLHHLQLGLSLLLLNTMYTDPCVALFYNRVNITHGNTCPTNGHQSKLKLMEIRD